jgi:60 kDa SS-A/Ro ribonucleoprotein
MTTTDPYAGFGTLQKQTPQNQPVPGRTDQVENNAGGFVFEIDPLSQLRRFLTIGSAGGTYYVNQGDLTMENGNLILALTQDVEQHKQMVDVIVEISEAGRAPKANPALFALAIACQKGETEGKQYARAAITKVVRTGTHLFIFVKYLQQFGGWSRGLRKAVGNWYTEKDTDKLSLQLIKYRQREGFTHRDVLRLSHPKVEGPGRRAAIDWAVKGTTEDRDSLPDFIRNFEAVQDPGNRDDIPQILRSTYLPWEALPDSAMNDTKVWDALLDNGMPINALVRQLPRLTRIGMLPPMGDGRTDEVVRQLLNPEAVKKSRIHPFQVLVALKTYQQGHSDRGSSSWTPSRRVLEAMDEMFYLSFGNVEPTGKRTMNALDVSGSMSSRAGGLPMSCYEVVAALAMVTVRTEPLHMTTAFTSHDHARSYGWGSANRGAELIDFPINKRQSLTDVMNAVQGLPHRATDCSLPMLHALHKDLEVDTFVVYTDNETWSGQIHPFQALTQYRKTTGINAKLVVVSITPTRFSIADPKDPGMLDISGFDSAVPQLISDFSAGRI